MPIEQEALAALAARYVSEMTSIRGRRVQRLLMREFGGAEYALIGRTGAGAQCLVGLSSTGAAICITEGKGKYAAVQSWAHGGSQATECRFDLHKDSLPLLASSAVQLVSLGLVVPPGAAPVGAMPLVARVLKVLG